MTSTERDPAIWTESADASVLEGLAAVDQLICVSPSRSSILSISRLLSRHVDGPFVRAREAAKAAVPRLHIGEGFLPSMMFRPASFRDGDARFSQLFAAQVAADQWQARLREAIRQNVRLIETAPHSKESIAWGVAPDIEGARSSTQVVIEAWCATLDAMIDINRNYRHLLPTRMANRSGALERVSPALVAQAEGNQYTRCALCWRLTELCAAQHAHTHKVHGPTTNAPVSRKYCGWHAPSRNRSMHDHGRVLQSRFADWLRLVEARGTLIHRIGRSLTAYWTQRERRLVAFAFAHLAPTPSQLSGSPLDAGLRSTDDRRELDEAEVMKINQAIRFVQEIDQRGEP